jgi:hypothetical protein
MKAIKLFSKANPINTNVLPSGKTVTSQPSASPTADGMTDKASQIELTTLLSSNFPLSEFCNSNTAERLGIDNNNPSEEVVTNLTVLARGLLQPLRNRIKKPVIVLSGFRCLELNRSLGSGDNSQHVKGEAVDIYVPGYTAYELAAFILNSHIEFDQLILENFRGPGTGWVHISRKQSGNRGEVLTYDGSGYKPGLVV